MGIGLSFFDTSFSRRLKEILNPQIKKMNAYYKFLLKICVVLNPLICGGIKSQQNRMVMPKSFITFGVRFVTMQTENYTQKLFKLAE